MLTIISFLIHIFVTSRTRSTFFLNNVKYGFKGHLNSGGRGVHGI